MGLFKDVHIEQICVFAMEQIVRLVGRKSCRILSSIIPPTLRPSNPTAASGDQRAKRMVEGIQKGTSGMIVDQLIFCEVA